MEPTLVAGDIILVKKYRQSACINPCQIVIFQLPEYNTIDPDLYSKNLIKRCIYVPGEKTPDDIIIPVKNKVIKLSSNHYRQFKYLIDYEQSHSDKAVNILDFTYQFKENYYFVVGDNLPKSFDSRQWGLLPENKIIGTTHVILCSINNSLPFYKRFRKDRFLKRL
jgi:signal peptidase I